MASKQNADKPQRKRTQRFNHPFPSVTRGHREHRAILTCFRDAHIPQALCSLCPLAQRVVKKNHVWGSSCHQYLPIRLMYFHFRTNDSESQHSRRPLIYANITLMMRIYVVLDKRYISVNKRFPALLGLDLGLSGFRAKGKSRPLL